MPDIAEKNAKPARRKAKAAKRRTWGREIPA